MYVRSCVVVYTVPSAAFKSRIGGASEPPLQNTLLNRETVASGDRQVSCGLRAASCLDAPELLT